MQTSPAAASKGRKDDISTASPPSRSALEIRSDIFRAPATEPEQQEWIRLDATCGKNI